MAEQVIPNNSAGRLHNILLEAGKKDEKWHVRRVWGEVLGADPDDTPELLKLIVEVIELIEKARKDILLLESINHDLYLKPFEKVDKVFSILNLDGAWQQSKRNIDPVTLQGLAFCADALTGRQHEEPIDINLLIELGDDVNSLLDKVLAADLGEDITSFLVQGLEEINLAILAYRVSGVEGLRRALDINLGGIFRFGDEIKNVGGNKVFPNFFAILTKLDKLVAFGLKTKQLVGPAIALL